MTQKYKIENGVRRHNPAYQPSSTAVATAVPFVNQKAALAAVPVPTAPSIEEEIVFKPTAHYDEAVARYETEIEPEIYFGGYEGDGSSIDELNAVLAKYEVPAGMLSKLLGVMRFQAMEIIVDDSGSMTLKTDAKDPNGQPMNRWTEARYRISQIVELLAHVTSPTIEIRFLNRRDVIELQRNAGELPATYIQRAEGVLQRAFSKKPFGSTPARIGGDPQLPETSSGTAHPALFPRGRGPERRAHGN